MMGSRRLATNVRLKRAYDVPDTGDGKRILVDRLWPRGLAKADAAIDEWIKEIAPSTALRKWFGHDPARWPEFRHRYLAELRANSQQVSRLRILAQQGPITLVFSARDEVRNDAVVLRELLVEGR